MKQRAMTRDNERTLPTTFVALRLLLGVIAAGILFLPAVGQAQDHRPTTVTEGEQRLSMIFVLLDDDAVGRAWTGHGAAAIRTHRRSPLPEGVRDSVDLPPIVYVREAAASPRVIEASVETLANATRTGLLAEAADREIPVVATSGPSQDAAPWAKEVFEHLMRVEPGPIPWLSDGAKYRSLGFDLDLRQVPERHVR